jgi:hypothetical protein
MLVRNLKVQACHFLVVAAPVSVRVTGVKAGELEAIGQLPANPGR